MQYVLYLNSVVEIKINATHYRSLHIVLRMNVATCYLNARLDVTWCNIRHRYPKSDVVPCDVLYPARSLSLIGKSVFFSWSWNICLDQLCQNSPTPGQSSPVIDRMLIQLALKVFRNLRSSMTQLVRLKPLLTGGIQLRPAPIHSEDVSSLSVDLR